MLCLELYALILLHLIEVGKKKRKDLEIYKNELNTK